MFSVNVETCRLSAGSIGKMRDLLDEMSNCWAIVLMNGVWEM